jgi:hypothetical protein
MFNVVEYVFGFIEGVVELRAGGVEDRIELVASGIEDSVLLITTPMALLTFPITSPATPIVEFTAGNGKDVVVDKGITEFIEERIVEDGTFPSFRQQTSMWSPLQTPEFASW